MANNTGSRILQSCILNLSSESNHSYSRPIVRSIIFKLLAPSNFLGKEPGNCTPFDVKKTQLFDRIGWIDWLNSKYRPPCLFLRSLEYGATDRQAAHWVCSCLFLRFLSMGQLILRWMDRRSLDGRSILCWLGFKLLAQCYLIANQPEIVACSTFERPRKCWWPIACSNILKLLGPCNLLGK
jgi:hypothetical protein